MENYGVKYMVDSERADFISWYNGQAGEQFNFRQKLESYCRSDVNILRQSSLKFRTLFLQITTDRKEVTMDDGNSENVSVAIDPFKFITIASVCMAVFRGMFLEETYSVETIDEKEKAEREKSSRCTFWGED